ncbi:MAG TPA: ssl1498 family light-harvesting-like protein [Allocoleopsis sp.]
MYTTVNEDGVLNNYAPELPTYYAEYPTVWQQQRYALQGAAATLLVGLLILTSLAVS